VGRALDSVLVQTHADLEVVVVDDASTDGTFEAVASYDDTRIRRFRNALTLGNARNRSRAAQLATGEFIKYVDQDDWIAPECVAEHLRLFDRRPALGLCFSRRELCFEDESSHAAVQWRRRYSEPHRAFASLNEINEGSSLLDDYVNRGFGENWIGEPTSVMVRAACLRATGLFNRFLRQSLDIDLWLRLMAFSEVGFLDSALCTRWVGSTGETQPNVSERRAWLDRLWMLEGLTEIGEIRRRYPMLARMRRGAQESMLVSLASGRYRNRRLAAALSDSARYLAHATQRRFGTGASVYDVLEPSA
jgi:glycosyltransferase involved in cell wall biosynthesis